MTDATPIILTRAPVELFKILKFEGIAASGAEAKHLISEAMVTVNGEVETRKRRKIVIGDQIEVAGQTLLLVSADAH